MRIPRRARLAAALAALVAGLLLLFWPDRTLRSLMVFGGAFLMVEGVLLTTGNLRRGGWRGLFGMGVGAAGALVGIILLLRPSLGVGTVAVFLGLWALVAGMGLGASAALLRWPLGILSGAALAVLGIVVLVERHAALVTVAQTVGVMAVLLASTQLWGLRRPGPEEEKP
ncbi:MAG: DUF308 domain-containing protein [Luteococcus japonicus]